MCKTLEAYIKRNRSYRGFKKLKILTICGEEGVVLHRPLPFGENITTHQILYTPKIKNLVYSHFQLISRNNHSHIKACLCSEIYVFPGLMKNHHKGFRNKRNNLKYVNAGMKWSLSSLIKPVDCHNDKGPAVWRISLCIFLHLICHSSYCTE